MSAILPSCFMCKFSSIPVEVACSFRHCPFKTLLRLHCPVALSPTHCPARSGLGDQCPPEPRPALEAASPELCGPVIRRGVPSEQAAPMSLLDLSPVDGPPSVSAARTSPAMTSTPHCAASHAGQVPHQEDNTHRAFTLEDCTTNRQVRWLTFSTSQN